MRHDEITGGARVLVVSASDSRFLPLLKGMITSIAPALALPNVALACLDIGLTPPDRQWLQDRGHQVATPAAHLGVQATEANAALRSFLARPFLPDYFPGYDVYVWIDSDVWLQDIGVLGQYVTGAQSCGMAITHERERGYKFQAWLLGWTGKHFLLGYGPVTAAYLLMQKHLNAGFFAISANAPHWSAWAARYQAAIEKTGALVPHDQFALNHAVHRDGRRGGSLANTRLLDPGCNWICDRGIPMWNDSVGAFCKPYAPYVPIGALHLAGPGKRQAYKIRRTSGGSFESFIVQGASPEAPVMRSPIATDDQVSAAPVTPRALTRMREGEVA